MEWTSIDVKSGLKPKSQWEEKTAKVLARDRK